MLNTIKNLFKSFKVEIPEVVRKELHSHFPEALSIDWYTLDKIYEAVFYQNEVEHIAKISNTGKIIEYKKNLWVNEVPDVIKVNCLKYGEIMSAIAIHSSDEISYELIIRNDQLVRKMFLLDSTGKLMNSVSISETV